MCMMKRSKDASSISGSLDRLEPEYSEDEGPISSESFWLEMDMGFI